MDYEQLAMCYAAAMARLACIDAICDAGEPDKTASFEAIQAILEKPLTVPVLDELRKPMNKAVAS